MEVLLIPASGFWGFLWDGKQFKHSANGVDLENLNSMLFEELFCLSDADDQMFAFIVPDIIRFRPK